MILAGFELLTRYDEIWIWGDIACRDKTLKISLKYVMLMNWIKDKHSWIPSWYNSSDDALVVGVTFWVIIYDLNELSGHADHAGIGKLGHQQLNVLIQLLPQIWSKAIWGLQQCRSKEFCHWSQMGGTVIEIITLNNWMRALFGDNSMYKV